MKQKIHTKELIMYFKFTGSIKFVFSFFSLSSHLIIQSFKILEIYKRADIPPLHGVLC